MDFRDHFSKVASAYRAHRPTYPEALFEFLARSAPRTDTACDVATGNGQAAVGLAAHFDTVVALDASPEQIEHAEPHSRVTYGVAPAEALALPDDSVDLLTVAQAAHWLNLDAFYPEAARVLRSDGIIAIWCYCLSVVNDEVDAVIRELYDGVLRSSWPPQRHFVDEHYQTLPFPCAPIDAPDFEVLRDWTAEDYLAYLATWSAVQRYHEQHGRAPIDAIAQQLRDAWGPEKHTVRWPIGLRLGKAPSLT